MIDISILICTYNRAQELQRTLAKMCKLAIPPGIQWEILIVDNNSTDDTREIVFSFENCLPVRYLLESRQGKSYALNSGVRECSASLILMTDDDVDVTPEWVSSYLKAAVDHPEAVFFGGKILTQWEAAPPPWLLENMDWLQSITRYDYGESPIILSDTRALFVGANMAIKKKLFDLGYQFRPDLGPRGDNRLTSARHGCEDSELQISILNDGLKGAYVPASVVYHRERPYRLTRRYTRWYCRERARDLRRREGVDASLRLWFGAPRYLWRVLFADLLRYLLTRSASSSRIWLQAECKLANTLGDMIECRQLTSKVRNQTTS